MGVDITTYRIRIGTFLGCKHQNNEECQEGGGFSVIPSTSSGGTEGLSLSAVIFLSVLIVMAGIEINPGPGDKIPQNEKDMHSSHTTATTYAYPPVSDNTPSLTENIEMSDNTSSGTPSLNTQTAYAIPVQTTSPQSSKENHQLTASHVLPMYQQQPINEAHFLQPHPNLSLQQLAYPTLQVTNKPPPITMPFQYMPYQHQTDLYQPSQTYAAATCAQYYPQPQPPPYYFPEQTTTAQYVLQQQQEQRLHDQHSAATQQQSASIIKLPSLQQYRPFFIPQPHVGLPVFNSVSQQGAQQLLSVGDRPQESFVSPGMMSGAMDTVTSQSAPAMLHQPSAPQQQPYIETYPKKKKVPTATLR